MVFIYYPVAAAVPAAFALSPTAAVRSDPHWLWRPFGGYAGAQGCLRQDDALGSEQTRIDGQQFGIDGAGPGNVASRECLGHLFESVSHDVTYHRHHPRRPEHEHRQVRRGFFRARSHRDSISSSALALREAYIQRLAADQNMATGIYETIVDASVFELLNKNLFCWSFIDLAGPPSRFKGTKTSKRNNISVEPRR